MTSSTSVPSPLGPPAISIAGGGRTGPGRLGPGGAGRAAPAAEVPGTSVTGVGVPPSIADPASLRPDLGSDTTCRNFEGSAL